jgi:hypothetical protein
MRKSGKIISSRLPGDVSEWLRKKSACSNTTVSELINLAISEMKQGMAFASDACGHGVVNSGLGYSDLHKLYNALLMAVSRKFPNESRHDTALRYIREREFIDAKCSAKYVATENKTRRKKSCTTK